MLNLCAVVFAKKIFLSPRALKIFTFLRQSVNYVNKLLVVKRIYSQRKSGDLSTSIKLAPLNVYSIF